MNKKVVVVLVVCATIVLFFVFIYLKSFSIIGKSDILACSEVVGEKAIECYSKLDPSKINPSDCGMIDLGNPYNYSLNRADCYKSMALLFEDASICYKIVNEEITRDDCYRLLAMKMKDASICENSGLSGSCIAWVAGETRDLSLCEKLYRDTDYDDRYWCYTRIAKATKDESICDLLSNFDVNENTVINCKQRVQNG